MYRQGQVKVGGIFLTTGQHAQLKDLLKRDQVEAQKYFAQTANISMGRARNILSTYIPL